MLGIYIQSIRWRAKSTLHLNAFYRKSMTLKLFEATPTSQESILFPAVRINMIKQCNRKWIMSWIGNEIFERGVLHELHDSADKIHATEQSRLVEIPALTVYKCSSVFNWSDTAILTTAVWRQKLFEGRISYDSVNIYLWSRLPWTHTTLHSTCQVCIVLI